MKRILIVEDSRTQAQALKFVLEDAKFAATVATCGEDALALIATETFDAILSDVGMPGMSGYELCTKIKNNPDTTDIPVILLTARSDPADIMRGLQCGADNFHVKPYREDNLLRTLRDATNADAASSVVVSEGAATVGITFLGEEYVIPSDTRKILSFLLSSIKDMGEANRELQENHAALEAAKAQVEQLAELMSARATTLQEKYAHILESINDGILTVDEFGNVQSLNPAAESILGWLGSEALGQCISDMIPLADEDLKPAELCALMEEVEDVLWEGVARRRDGTVCPVDVGISSMHYGGSRSFVWVIRDISERKRAEETRLILSLAVDQNPAAVVVTNVEQMVEYINPRFSEITGYDSADIINQKLTVFESSPNDEVPEEKWRGAIAGDVWRGELKCVRKNGEPFWITLTISPVAGQDGTINHLVAIFEDITENRETQRALQQAQKMEVVGNLTGGIAHDFNNLLAVIIGNLQLLERRTKDDDRLQKMTKSALEAGFRGADLTRQLLAFSRRQELELKKFPVNELVAGMESLLRRTIGADIRITTQLTEDAGAVKSDSAQLESALLNLSINARDAMPEGGKLVIETSNVDLDHDYAAEHDYANTGPHVCISVTDTGTGIAPDVMKRIFEPFFTTKDVGKGTGLGLSMVYGFVKQSGGHINVTSEMGKGTRFSIYLPLVEASGAHIDRFAQSADDMPTGSETILIVEDDRKVRETAAMLLEDLGYTVVSAASGPKALEALAVMGTVDLVFTDMVMPEGMNGHQLADRIREAFPKIKILLTSGYPRDAFKDGRRYALIQKPYTHRDLAFRVRQTLADDHLDAGSTPPMQDGN